MRSEDTIFIFHCEDIRVAMEFFSSSLEFWLFETENISIIVFISLL